MAEPEHTAEAGAVGPSKDLARTLPGETLAGKVDALFAKHIRSSPITNDTASWNIVHAFKEDVKALVAERS